VRTLNLNAKAGQGSIIVQPRALLLFSGTGNLNAGQLVEVRSNLSNYGVIGMADNSPLASYNLRTPFGVGVVAPSVGAFSNSLLASPQSGGGVLAINSLYSQALDLSKIGDGSWFLGSTTNGEGMNGTFNGGTLGAGAAYSGLGTAATYRLGAGGSTLYIGLYPGATGSVPNQLSGSANLVIGAPLVNSSATPSNGLGTVILNSAQNYTGQTVVNRGSTLEVRGAMATSGYEVFGTMVVGGLASVGSTPLTLRPGATLRLDDNFDVLAVGSNRNGTGT
jgi:autotransporter-associated beta strand protein